MASESLDNNDCLCLRETRSVWAIYALILALVTAFFFADLRHFLQRSDEPETFRAHELIAGDFSFFLSPEKPMASGRIVDELALYLVYLFFGNDPGVFHVLVAIVHALASFALAFAFRRLGAEMATSLVGGLLFLCNVAHVEAVQWISALEYPFAVLNISWALCVYASYIESRRRALLPVFYGAVLLSVLTHFVAVLVLPLCLLWGSRHGGAIVERVKELLPLLLLLPAVLFFVFGLTGNHTTTATALNASLNQSVLFLLVDSARSFIWLLGRLLSMAHWVLVMPGEQAMAELWLGGVALLLLLWSIWKGRMEVQIWGLWTLLFTAPFVPAAAVHASIARYVYLASAGSSFFIAWALLRGSRRLRHGGTFVAGLVLLGLVVSSYVAEDRIANLTRYNTGRFFVVHADPRIGVALISQALATNDHLIPVAEAYLYLLQGALEIGVDYEEILQRGLRAAPEDLDLRLATQLSIQFTGAAHGGSLDRLQEPYPAGAKAFAHRTGILSQHFGNYFAERGETVRAARAYRTSLQYAPTNLNTAMRLIETLRRNGRHIEAAVVIEEVWSLHQANSEFLYLAALCLFEADLLDEAQSAVERGLQRMPTADLHALQGEIWAQRGLPGRAAEAYGLAIAADPHKPEPLMLLAHLHREQGALKSAVEVLERAVGLFPNAALAWYNLGNTRHALGSKQGAAIAYGHAARLNPDHAQAHSNLGLVALELGDRPSALAALQRAADLHSQNPATYTALARLYMDEGQRQQALAVYVILVRGDWEQISAGAYVRAGIDLQALGAGQMATEAYRRALEYDSDNMAARINLGWLSYDRGDYDGAIRLYEHVLAKETNATAQFNLGLALLARGDRDKALATYAEAVQRFGTDEAVRIGAVEDLRALAAQGIEDAQVVLRQYWFR